MSIRSCLVAIACAVVVGNTALAESEPALNISFFGNSFMIGNAPARQSVPQLVRTIATAGGYTPPNVDNAAISSYSLADHLANSSNLNRISAPIDFAAPGGFQWDYVVIQELSTRPTDISGQTRAIHNGDPSGFKNDAQTLYGIVRDHSPSVTPVLFETWARSPQNTTDLPNFYPSLTSGQSAPYYAAADQMQSELKRYYTEACEQIGPKARLAPAGDAFQAGGYIGFYGGDYYHENNRGAVLAALVAYETIYGADSRQIPYATMGQHLVLGDYAVNTEAQWQTYTSLAHASVIAVPEPASLSVIMAGTLLIMRRRRSA